MDFRLEYNLLDDTHVFNEITYIELMDIFNTFDTSIVFIGGPWCKNCQAIMARLNMLAKENNIQEIRCYNPRFINSFNEEDDLRKCSTLEIKMDYYYLIEKIGFKSEELVENTLIPKMHIPFIIAVKNGTCVGYYSKELLLDSYLHEENSSVDLTNDFDSNIIKLLNLIKE